MKSFVFFVCFLVSQVVAPSEAVACLIPTPTIFDKIANKPLKQLADCSFVNGGVFDGYSGQAAEDIGAGRVTQLIQYGSDGALKIADRVAVVDCLRSETLVIKGIPNPESESTCGVPVVLQGHLAPQGVIDVRAGRDLAGLASRLRSLDVVFSEDDEQVRFDGGKMDRINAFCGCKIFYPDSPGAQR